MTHEQKECLNRNHWLNKKSVSISEPCEPSESHPNASETLLEPSAWFWVWDGFKRLWDGCRRLSDVSEMVSGGSRMVSASLFPGRIFQNAVETPHRLEINPHSMMVVTHCCHIKFTRNPTSLGPQHFREGHSHKINASRSPPCRHPGSAVSLTDHSVHSTQVRSHKKMTQSLSVWLFLTLTTQPAIRVNAHIQRHIISKSRQHFSQGLPPSLGNAHGPQRGYAPQPQASWNEPQP